MTMLNRRHFVGQGAAVSLLAPFASIANSMPNPDARFVLVILRGGLDGLAAVPPYGDKRYRSLRGELALDRPGSSGGILDLDGHFGLHPSLQGMHRLYAAGELAVLHAVATPYRERSHFDGQKILEAGGTTASASAGGWLNRALISMSDSGLQRQAVALAPNVPLVLRGEHSVSSWSPSRLPDSSDDTISRVRAMYEATDPLLAERLIEALNAREIAGSMETDRRGGRQQALAPLITAAGRFLRAPDGPRIAVIDVGGWDTHANQGARQGPLALRLGALDKGLASLKTELAETWSYTSILVVTEFGRTAAVNGTRGTDHGTAGCAMLAGGAVAGGRVIADWPGLAANELHENRDLRATLDMRGVFKGLLAAQFGLAESALEHIVFPDSERVAPLEGLLSA
jgi:uncharacterized protein (DUF1501 family)